MLKDKENNKYFIKENGIITEVSEEIYLNYKKKNERECLCQTCVNFDCNRYVHINIKNCSEVTDSTYILNEYTIKHSNKSETIKHKILDFDIFNCTMYKKYTSKKERKNRKLELKYNDKMI